MCLLSFNGDLQLHPQQTIMSSQVLFSSVPSSTPLSSLHPSPAQTFAPLPETSRPASPTPSCLHKPSLEKPDLQALPPSTSSHPDHPLHHPSYTGDGTPGSPYVVSWHEHDEGNPREWRDLKRWAISLMGSLEMLVVTFGTRYVHLEKISAVCAVVHAREGRQLNGRGS
jgi:hypothetical protein